MVSEQLIFNEIGEYEDTERFHPKHNVVIELGARYPAPAKGLLSLHPDMFGLSRQVWSSFLITVGMGTWPSLDPALKVNSLVVMKREENEMPGEKGKGMHASI